MWSLLLNITLQQSFCAGNLFEIAIAIGDNLDESIDLVTYTAIAILIAGDRVIKKSPYIPKRLVPKIEKINQEKVAEARQ